MNLAEVRSWFIQDSGRYDLVNADGSDNGANKFINAGQNFLDQLGVVPKRKAKNYVKLQVGQQNILIPSARVIENVLVIYDGARRILSKMEELELHRLIPDLRLVSKGIPSCYVLSDIRLKEGIKANEIPIGSDLPRASYGSDENHSGLTIIPAPDKECFLEVIGVLFSPELKLDDDHSFWTMRHPGTLVKAGLYQLEVFFRNTEGANDWLASIKSDLTLLEMDLVEEESNNIKQIWG